MTIDVAVARQRNPNAAAVEFLRRHGRDGFGGVLDDVGQPLRNQTAVEIGRHRIFGDVRFEIDIGISDPHQKHRLANGIGDILRGNDRLGHAREARKLVDHAANIVDLPHDGAGALLEHGLVFGDRRCRICGATVPPTVEWASADF